MIPAISGAIGPLGPARVERLADLGSARALGAQAGATGAIAGSRALAASAARCRTRSTRSSRPRPTATDRRPAARDRPGHRPDAGGDRGRERVARDAARLADPDQARRGRRPRSSRRRCRPMPAPPTRDQALAPRLGDDRRRRRGRGRVPRPDLPDGLGAELLDPADRSRPGPDRQDHEHARHQGHHLPAPEQRHRARGRVGQDAPRRASRSRPPGCSSSQPARASRCSTSSSSAPSNFQQQITYQRALEGQLAPDDREHPGRLLGAGAARPAQPPGPAVRRQRPSPSTAAVLLSGSTVARSGRGQGHRPAGRLERPEPARRQGDDHRRHGTAAVADSRRGRRRRHLAARQAGSAGAATTRRWRPR